MTYSEAHNIVTNSMTIVSYLAQKLDGIEDQAESIRAELAKAQAQIDKAAETIAEHPDEPAWGRLAEVHQQVTADLSALTTRADQVATDVGKGRVKA